MQPWYEAVAIPEGQSCLIYDRQLPAFAFNWHHHPEFELTLTLNSRGTRLVGGHLGAYDDGDLVLLGPDLPHAWQSQALVDPAGVHRAIVCWFTRDWAEALVRLMPELGGLGGLLAEAAQGVQVGPATAATLRPAILELAQLPADRRIVALQGVLVALAGAADRSTLATASPGPGAVPADRRRMVRVLDWLHAHYDRPIRLAPLCALAHVSESQLQRIFRRSTRMSISAYVTRLRVGRACTLLIRSDLSLSAIAAECGFTDQAHLARSFRSVTGQTPSSYRREFRALGAPSPEGRFPMQAPPVRSPRARV